MKDEFANLPPPSIGSVEHQQARDNKVDSWVHELELKVANLDTALAEVLNPGPSTDNTKAKRRVDHEMKRLKALVTVMRKGRERT